MGKSSKRDSIGELGEMKIIITVERSKVPRALQLIIFTLKQNFIWSEIKTELDDDEK